MNIFVTNLFDMPEHVRDLRPGYLVSIIQTEFQPDTPSQITPSRHHRVHVHDISEPTPGAIVPGHDHVTELINFLNAWPLDDSLMVHCYAGVSRSTAVALLAHFIKTGDEFASAAALRAAAPHALPNRRIVALADDILGCGGRLVAAREGMGAGEPVVEGPLVTLGLA